MRLSSVSTVWIPVTGPVPFPCEMNFAYDEPPVHQFLEPEKMFTADHLNLAVIDPLIVLLCDS